MNRNLSINRRHTPTLSGFSTPFEPIFNKLDQLFTDFEETSSNFPPLKLPSKGKKKVSKDRKSVKKQSETPLPTQVHRRSPKLIEENFSAPYSVSFESGIGPGSYKMKNFSISGGKLSQAPRFFMSPIDKAEQFIKLKKRTTEEMPIIERNKAMGVHSSHKKLEKIEKSKKVKNFQLEVHKTVKKSLEENNHLQKLNNYLNKVKAIEWKLRKSERKIMKPAWTVLMIGLSLVNCVRFKIIHRKLFKKSALRFFSLTVLTCRFIGKLKRLLYKHRLTRLRLCLIKRISRLKIWMIQRKKNHLSAMLDIIESHAMSSFMTIFLIKFINHVLYIQRTFKKSLQVKRERFRSIQKLFIKHQNKINRKLRNKSSRNSFNVYDIGETEIRGFYKFCLNLHIKEFRVFRDKRKEYLLAKEELLQNDPLFKDFDPPPEKPSFFMYKDFIENFSKFIRVFKNKKTEQKMISPRN